MIFGEKFKNFNFSRNSFCHRIMSFYNIKKRKEPLHFSQITLEFQKTYFLKIFYIENLRNYSSFFVKNKKSIVAADFELKCPFLLCFFIVLTFGGIL